MSAYHHYKQKAELDACDCNTPAHSTSGHSPSSRYLRDQMLRKTVMASSEAVVLFDVGAGQVDTPGMQFLITLLTTRGRLKAEEIPKKTAVQSFLRINFQ